MPKDSSDDNNNNNNSNNHHHHKNSSDDDVELLETKLTILDLTEQRQTHGAVAAAASISSDGEEEEHCSILLSNRQNCHRTGDDESEPNFIVMDERANLPVADQGTRTGEEPDANFLPMTLDIVQQYRIEPMHDDDITRRCIAAEVPNDKQEWISERDDTTRKPATASIANNVPATTKSSLLTDSAHEALPHQVAFVHLNSADTSNRHNHHPPHLQNDEVWAKSEMTRTYSTTPTVRAVPVPADASSVYGTYNINNNNDNSDEVNEALIQQLLQQDEEGAAVLAVLAVPSMEEEELAILRETVRQLHAQLQSQDEQVRQLRHQLETLSSSTSSLSSTKRRTTSTSESLPERKGNNQPTWQSFWRTRKRTIVGISSCLAVIVLIVIIATVTLSNQASQADGDSFTPVDQSTSSPTASPSLVGNYTLSPTLYPSDGYATTTPSITAAPTESPSFQSGDTDEGHAQSDPNVVIVVVIVAVLAGLALFFCILFAFIRRRRQQSLSDLAPHLSAPAEHRVPQQEEQLRNQVVESLNAALSSRADTLRDLEAILGMSERGSTTAKAKGAK